MLRGRLDHFTSIHLQEKRFSDVVAKYAIDGADGYEACLFVARHDLIADSNSIDAFGQPVRHQHGRIPDEASPFRWWRRRIGKSAVNLGIIELFRRPFLRWRVLRWIWLFPFACRVPKFRVIRFFGQDFFGRDNAVRQNKVEGGAGLVLFVLAARGADTLGREAVKEQPLALMAVPPIALGRVRRVRSRNIMREYEVEGLGRVVLLVLAARGADSLDWEAIKEQPLAFMAVPPIGLGVVSSRHIAREVEVEGRGRVVLLVLALRGADSLDREAVKEQPLALLAVPPIGLGWHIRSPFV